MNRNHNKLFTNVKHKKLKKNALDPVDYEAEKLKDPKYKTELCKSWMETHFCVYGNQCRFAHGKHELMNKPVNSNYKKKQCKSFQEEGFCPYGMRCNFIHNNRKLSDINLPYNYVCLFINHKLLLLNQTRLPIFKEITSNKDTYALSLSPDSNKYTNASSEDENYDMHM